jgi:hypothetical protein
MRPFDAISLPTTSFGRARVGQGAKAHYPDASGAHLSLTGSRLMRVSIRLKAGN